MTLTFVRQCPVSNSSKIFSYATTCSGCQADCRCLVLVYNTLLSFKYKTATLSKFTEAWQYLNLVFICVR